MAISKHQLLSWSNQGATAASMETHKSIRCALDQHTWPNGMSYDAYLQGSYRNGTNIRGNSDVDLVVETDSVFYSNLAPDEKSSLKLTGGGFSWAEFRAEVRKALINYYTPSMIDDISSEKCIKVRASGNRLHADVIPCVQYRKYRNLSVIATGMTFWTKSTNRQFINYPKNHFDNGAAKNQRVQNQYKPSLRMFKNARENFKTSNIVYPSYFVECLLYNVLDDCYLPTPDDTYVAVVNKLNVVRNAGQLAQFTTQSGHQELFGVEGYQWNESHANGFINNLIELWNRWQG